MKKITIMSLMFAVTYISAVTASAVNAQPWKKPSQNLRVINVCKVADNDLKEIMLGQHPEVAVEFSAQTALPISFFVKGDLVNLVDNAGLIEIKQTFYVRCVEEILIFSTNLTDWKPFIEFITGDASVTLSVQDGKPFIVAGSEINTRL